MKKTTTDYATWNDFDLAVAAKSSNSAAWMELWGRYRKVMISIISKVRGLDEDEQEAECYAMFAHKLGLFDSTKVTSPDSFTFSFMLIGGIKNLRTKLINKSKLENALDDSEYREFSEEDQYGVAFGATKAPDFEVNKYAAENLYIRSTQDIDTARIRRLYNNLSSFQQDCMRLRRAGYKLQEIAEALSCSLSRVKTNLRDAKLVASEIFEISYAV